MTSRRAEQVAEARRLKAAGLLQREIAERMGIGRGYVSDLLCDPDRSKALARRAAYSRPCPSCGAMMDGSNGRSSAAPRVCHRCAGDAYRTWTHAVVLDLIRVWTAEHGRSPSVLDWSKPHARQFLTEKSPTASKALQLIAALADGRHYPDPDTVRRLFGSWEDAIRAAGFVSRYRKRSLGPDYALTHGRRSDEDIIDELRSLSHNGVARSYNLCKRSLQLLAKERFGSWATAVHTAGLITKREYNVLARQERSTERRVAA